MGGGLKKNSSRARSPIHVGPERGRPRSLEELGFFAGERTRLLAAEAAHPPSPGVKPRAAAAKKSSAPARNGRDNALRLWRESGARIFSHRVDSLHPQGASNDGHGTKR